MPFPPELHELDLLSIYQKRKWEQERLNNFFKMSSRCRRVGIWTHFILFVLNSKASALNTTNCLPCLIALTFVKLPSCTALRQSLHSLVFFCFFTCLEQKANLSSFWNSMHSSVHDRHHEWEDRTLWQWAVSKTLFSLFYRKSLLIGYRGILFAIPGLE